MKRIGTDANYINKESIQRCFINILHQVLSKRFIKYTILLVMDFLKKVYANALVRELKSQGFSVQQQVPIKVY